MVEPTLAAAGVPLRTPLLGLRVTQPGSVPAETDQPAAGIVWLAVNVWLNAKVAVALVGTALVMAGKLEITTVCLPLAGESALPWLFVACTAKEDIPAAVGVPLSTPALDRVIPAGNVSPDTKAKVGAGFPDAVKVKL